MTGVQTCALPIYRSGECLTNNDFGNFKAGSNLLSAIVDSSPEDRQDCEMMKRDFENGQSGQISLTYQGAQEDVCYIPIEGTEWMMAILVRDNVMIKDHAVGSTKLFRSPYPGPRVLGVTDNNDDPEYILIEEDHPCPTCFSSMVAPP